MSCKISRIHSGETNLKALSSGCKELGSWWRESTAKTCSLNTTIEDHHCEARFFRNSTPKGPKPEWHPLRRAAVLSCCGVPLRKCLLRQRSSSASRDTVCSGAAGCCVPSAGRAYPDSQHLQALPQALLAPPESIASGVGNTNASRGKPCLKLDQHQSLGRRRGVNERAADHAPEERHPLRSRSRHGRIPVLAADASVCGCLLPWGFSVCQLHRPHIHFFSFYHHPVTMELAPSHVFPS